MDRRCTQQQTNDQRGLPFHIQTPVTVLRTIASILTDLIIINYKQLTIYSFSSGKRLSPLSLTMKHTISIIACLFALLVSGCEENDTPTTPPSQSEQQAPTNADSSQVTAETQAPPQPLTTQANWDEIQTIVTQSKGKVVVVDIWSTYCAPCMQEFPHLLALQKEHPQNVICLSFNINFSGLPNQTAETDLPLIHQFLERQTSQVINFVSTQTDEEIYAQLEIVAIPAIVVFNQRGERVATVMEKSGYQTRVFPLVKQLLE